MQQPVACVLIVNRDFYNINSNISTWFFVVLIISNFFNHCLLFIFFCGQSTPTSQMIQFVIIYLLLFGKVSISKQVFQFQLLCNTSNYFFSVSASETETDESKFRINSFHSFSHKCMDPCIFPILF